MNHVSSMFRRFIIKQSPRAVSQHNNSLSEDTPLESLASWNTEGESEFPGPRAPQRSPQDSDPGRRVLGWGLEV